MIYGESVVGMGGNLIRELTLPPYPYFFLEYDDSHFAADGTDSVAKELLEKQLLLQHVAPYEHRYGRVEPLTIEYRLNEQKHNVKAKLYCSITIVQYIEELVL